MCLQGIRSWVPVPRLATTLGPGLVPGTSAHGWSSATRRSPPRGGDPPRGAGPMPSGRGEALAERVGDEWARSRQPVLASRWLTWVLTVASETNSRAAISALDRPVGDAREHLDLARGQPVVGTASCPAASARRRRRGRRAAGGQRLQQPALHRRVELRLARGHGRRSPCRISSAPASLVRKPRAPARSAANTQSSSAYVVSTTTRARAPPVVEPSVASTPSHARHVQVHQDHVRVEGRRLADGVVAVDRGADHLDPAAAGRAAWPGRRGRPSGRPRRAPAPAGRNGRSAPRRLLFWWCDTGTGVSRHPVRRRGVPARRWRRPAPGEQQHRRQGEHPTQQGRRADERQPGDREPPASTPGRRGAGALSTQGWRHHTDPCHSGCGSGTVTP